MAVCQSPWEDQSCCPEDLLPAWIWQGTWVSGRTYAVNAALESDQSTWVCIKAHTSDAGNKPPADPAVTPLTEFWELMALGGAVIRWEGLWDIGVSYQINDAVQHLGSAYVALKTSTGVEPGTDATTWDILVLGQAGTSAGYAQRFDAETDTSLDPGASNFTINGTDTEIATDDLNIVPVDISAWIADFAGGTTPGDLGQVTIKEQESPDTVWKRFLLTALPAEAGTFTRLTVVLVDSAGTFTPARTYAVEFARTGDIGGSIAGSGTSVVDDIAVWADAGTPGTTIKNGGKAVADLVDRAEYTAVNSILKADSQFTPIALQMAQDTILGRSGAGVIDALTATEVRTLINVEDGATADQPAFETVTLVARLTAGALLYTAPLNLAYAWIRVVGGGGGGGGSDTGSLAAGGGGGGGYAESILTAAQIGVSQMVTVGAAGLRGAAGGVTGGGGGTSSFGALLTATGGGGGINNNLGGAGGVGTGGIYNVPGSRGVGVMAVDTNGGRGGESVMSSSGVGGGPGQANGTNAGTNSGSGGGGASGVASVDGRDGGAGVVLIMEFLTS